MQKITLISFDNWNYDKEIVVALNKINVVATHINIGKYKHKNIFERLKNVCSKIFLNKNLKFKNRQEFILETLTKLGKQDQILVLNPDLIDLDYHLQIKQRTDKYICYLYDSIARSKYPIEHLLDGVFDKIFTFDGDDSQKYDFEKINNYIYLDKQTAVKKPDYKIVTISSFDKRFPLFNAIANQLQEKKCDFKFILISRNISYKVLKFKFKNKIEFNKLINFQSKKIGIQKLINHYNNAKIILDLVQGFQKGLSFRVFEAMALQKKLITDNKSIAEYEFYNPNNILIIDKENPIIPSSFIDSEYEEIPVEIYNKFTIDSWVKKVFKL